MNRELRRLSVAVLIMFLALFTSTTIIQVVEADSLRTDPRNARTLYSSYSAERGPILIDGVPIAESVPDDSEYKFQRVYSEPALYAPITGYFTLNQGNTGVEGALNDYLSGSANAQFLDRVTAIFTGQSTKGASVELTIDREVQQAAWDALGDYSGSIVALNPKTGAILAMVSKPSFDPNLLAMHDSSQVIANYRTLEEDPSHPLANRAIAGDLYHPGSVFKVLMAAAAIDSGQYTPETPIPNPPRLQLPLSNSVITNSGGSTCGGGTTVTLADALRLSCNIPFAQVGAQLGEATIDDYARAFGFGERFSIPMTTTPSVYPNGQDAAQLMLSSFGQGDNRVHPLQIAMVSAAIANGGVLMTPTLIERVSAPDLTELVGPQLEIHSTPVRPDTAAQVTRMMVAGVASGAASNARMDGVDVAGKTGTAENGEGEPYTLWFTGFAPADDPEVAIAVVVENGAGRGQNVFGNQIAAPIAKRVLEAVLNR